VKFYIHIALDMFGAEALGRAAAWLSAAADPVSEYHLYVWGGCGEPPVQESFWDQRYPIWDERIDTPSSTGFKFETNRKELAAAVRDWLVSKAGIDNFRALTHDVPDRLVDKQAAVEPVLTFSLSLLDPNGSALLLGHLAGRAERRRIGASPYMAHVVAGVGFSSGPFTDAEEQARAVGARALLDVETLFRQYRPRDIATPVYLIGERSFDNFESDRAAQCALMAMTLVAITRGPDVAADSPFDFGLDGAGNPRRAMAEYDPNAPFSAVGGYLVWCPAPRLSTLLSSRIAALAFKMLARQQGCAGFAQTSRLVPSLPALAGFLEGLERQTIVRVWDRAVDPERIPWDPNTVPPPSGCFDLERVRAIYGTVFKEKEWVRVIEVYGDERFRETPLDSWETELEEIQELVENGVLPRRKQRVALITRRALVAFLDSVEEGISAIFGRAFEPPVGDQPHRAAQAFLGLLQSSLEAKGIALERETAHAKAVGQTNAGELRKSAVALRQQLAKAIEAVPSPLAVLLRLAPVFVLCVAFFVLLPIDLKWIDAPPLRLTVGVAVGIALALGVYIRKIETVRQELLGGVQAWRRKYEEAIAAEDEALREASYRDLLDRMTKCLEWLLEGQKDEPPLPDILEPKTKKRPTPLEDDPDLMRPQETLSRFRSYLNAAASAFQALEHQCLQQFQSSRLEAALPMLSVSDESSLTAELASVADSDPQETEEAAAVRLLAEMKQDLIRRWSRAWRLPFSSSPSDFKGWRRSFLLPQGKDLLEPETRQASSAFQFLETLSAYLQERSPQRFDLPTRLEEYVRECGTAVVGSELYRDYTGRAAVSVAVADPAPFTHVSAAGVSDALAVNLQRRNSLGRGKLSIYVQCSAPVNASQVIFYPSELDPITPMGKAWKAHLSRPFSGAAFQPVEGLGEASA